jgi:hypothetical protein
MVSDQINAKENPLISMEIEKEEETFIEPPNALSLGRCLDGDGDEDRDRRYSILAIRSDTSFNPSHSFISLSLSHLPYPNIQTPPRCYAYSPVHSICFYPYYAGELDSTEISETGKAPKQYFQLVLL